MTIYVRQYLRPDGRVEIVTTEISDDLAEAYAAMHARGWNLAAEVLTTGHVSLTIEDRVEGEDRAIRVVDNGPGVQAAIEDMLRAVQA